MKEEAVKLRYMRGSDIDSAMQLSAGEGWNQTEKDWTLFLRNPQNVCLVAEVDNVVIGTTTAINYAHKLAWIAMVLVSKRYRGLGISKLLLTQILKEVASCKSIKLDATSAGRSVYEKFGFKDEYVIVRMVNGRVEKPSNHKREVIREPVHIVDVPEVIDFDATVFGASRYQLIQFLVEQYPEKGWVLKDHDAVIGFALGRDGNKYHHIGPVAAATSADAKSLILNALEKLNGQAVVVDVLNDKGDLISWLESIGFIEQRRFIRMYKNENVFPGVVEKHYLICGPEFG